MSCQLDGETWNQNAFKYQSKCLGWIRQDFQKLSQNDKTIVSSILKNTGCERLLTTMSNL